MENKHTYQFVEKLIERLEEYKTKAYVTGFTNNPYELGACHAMDDAKKIVDQLAEEYNNDFCEWKFETTGIVWHCNGCETYNLPYAMNLRIIADDFECKCPHCGKKIKVV